MRVVVAVLALATAAWAPLAAAPDAESLLERAFLRPRSVAHVGTQSVTVAVEPGPPAEVKVSCDGHGRERREHLAGPARGLVVLTDGQSTWQRRPGEALWGVTPCAPTDRASWDRLRRNYEFEPRGREEIAGRSAMVVAINSRHPGNPRQVLWVDLKTALVLRTDAYSYTGVLAARTAYSSLALKAPPAATLAPPRANEAAPALDMSGLQACAGLGEMERRLGYRPALPARPPLGYEPVAYYVRGMGRMGLLPVVRYDDGLNSLTLFVTPGRGRGRRFRGGRGDDATDQVKGQEVARATYGRYTYTLVGDHDPQDLLDALQSIR